MTVETACYTIQTQRDHRCPWRDSEELLATNFAVALLMTLPAVSKGPQLEIKHLQRIP